MVVARTEEIVLPSGAFARVRPMTGADYLLCQPLIKAGIDPTFAAIIVAVMIDDKRVEYEQLLDMDIRDVHTLANAVAKMIVGPVRT